MAAISDNARIQLLGADALMRAMRDLPDRLEKKILEKTLLAGARPVFDETKRLVPVDTGKLKASITIRPTTKKKRQRKPVGYNIVTGTREELGIPADDPYYYPAAVEFGQNVHVHAQDVRGARQKAALRKGQALVAGKRISSRVVPARSYMRAGMDNRRAQAIAVIRTQTGKELEVEMTKLVKRNRRRMAREAARLSSA